VELDVLQVNSLLAVVAALRLKQHLPESTHTAAAGSQ
jgi:hypothetical protein